MNVSPHHQRPTKYPWPGPASAAWVVRALAAVVLIGFVRLSGSPADENAEPSPTGTRITAPQDIIGTLAGDPPVGLGATPTGPTGSYTSVTAYYAITATSAAGESMASNILTGVTGATNNQLQITWQPYAYATGYNVYWSPNSDLSGAQLIATLSGGQTTS